jgi:ABC-type transport system involved in multi-copper enzyme maturation permease subunit
MTTWLPTPLVLKEGRALAPIWLGAVVTIVAATAAGMLPAALLTFIAGSAALGVFSIGHEYAHRTLTTFLAQPLNRSRLLLSKVIVLAPLLALLSLVTAAVVLQADGIERVFGAARIGALAPQPIDEALISGWQVAIVVLTPLLGLCVAPWMTMLCRNVTAGWVFTLSIPAVLWIAGQIARAASVNFDFVDLEVGNPFGYAPALTLWAVGMFTAIVVAAVHGRRLFVGLEALDTPRDLMPAVVRRLRRPAAPRVRSPHHAARRRGPAFQAVKKEVRLYDLTFVLAALYVIGWVALWVAGAGAYLADDVFEGFAAMYGLFVALLVGAISIAEERALGTADTQRIQPWAFWKRSLAKFTTAGIISLLLGLAVPIGLEAMLPLIQGSGQPGPHLGFLRYYLPNPLNGAAATLLLTTLFSGYVSSLCVGGLRSLMVALPLSFTLFSINAYMFYAGAAFARTLRIEHGLAEFWWFALPTVSPADYRTAFLYSRWMAAATFVGFAALLLFLLLRNSNSGEDGRTLARKQLPWIAAYPAVGAVLIRGGDELVRWWLFTH